ncbi:MULTISPECIES: hypothetical protein [unclassified Vibrio]|uniref:hypothetical protein n=1 Tax=unclassified Vibrio TaxID=2614977 RepID=UPI001BB20B0F|nr:MULTISPECIES: hypothetical protein [unclassified Vibrio]
MFDDLCSCNLKPSKVLLTPIPSSVYPDGYVLTARQQLQVVWVANHQINIGNIVLNQTTALKSVLILAASSFIFGCAETPNEYINLKGKYADDYELDADDYSVPSRFLYPLTWVKPEHRANNLDNYFYDTKESHKLVNTASVMTVAGAALGSLSPFEAGMQLLAQQGVRMGYSASLGNQMLYTIKKVDHDQDLDAQAQALNKIAINTVKAAMGSNATEWYHNEGADNFYLLDYTRVEGSNDVSCNAVYSPCYANTDRIPMLIRDNNGYIPLVPQYGDYMVAQTFLPLGFPIEKLKFSGDDNIQQILYVPAMKLNQQQDLWKKENLDYFEDWYKKERVSVNPYIKDLSNGAVMYFNPHITAKQKDDHSLYRVFDLK